MGKIKLKETVLQENGDILRKADAAVEFRNWFHWHENADNPYWIEAETLRKKFVKDYPVESIRSITLQDYAIGDYSYIYRVRRELQGLASMGNAFPSTFGIYLRQTDNSICLSKTYLERYGNDYYSAFSDIKEEIYRLLNGFRTIGFAAVDSCGLNRMFIYKLLLIYYPDDMFPVCAKGTLEKYCNAFNVSYSSKEVMYIGIQRLLDLQRNSKLLKELSRSEFMSFGDWLIDHKVFLDKADIIDDLDESASDFHIGMVGKRENVISKLQFLSSIDLPKEIEVKVFGNTNRIHLKYHSQGFALIDLRNHYYHFSTREKYLEKLHINGYRLVTNQRANNALIERIPYTDTSVLFKLIDFVMSNRRIITSITVQEREESEKCETEINKETDNLVLQSVFENQEIFKYTARPEHRKDVSELIHSNNVNIYPRSPAKKANALLRAGFRCEIDTSHVSFIARRTGKPYMETHHLIPLEYWESFENSLDVEANIVCLCSNCHNEIHYGVDAARLIKPMYENRVNELQDAGIGIELNQLLDMYNDSFIQDK